MKMLLLVLLLVPQLASARVYMCVDPATGKTSFTDRACQANTSVEEVRVDATLLEPDSRSGRDGSSKTWRSERDVRKTGMDYNAQRRSLYQNRATAGTD